VRPNPYLEHAEYLCHYKNTELIAEFCLATPQPNVTWISCEHTQYCLTSQYGLRKLLTLSNRNDTIKHWYHGSDELAKGLYSVSISDTVDLRMNVLLEQSCWIAIREQKVSIQ